MRCRMSADAAACSAASSAAAGSGGFNGCSTKALLAAASSFGSLNDLRKCSGGKSVRSGNSFASGTRFFLRWAGVLVLISVPSSQSVRLGFRSVGSSTVIDDDSACMAA